MRTVTETYNVYSFDELSDDAKDKAREWWRNGDDYLMLDDTCDDIKELLQNIGFINVRVFYSGFCSQGDGACFIGDYTYSKGISKIKKEYPQWVELHQFIDGLINIQKQYFYSLEFSLYKNSSYYQHENTVSITDVYRSDGKEINDNVEDELIELCRSFMQDIYSTLEKEYNYLNGDEYIDESIRCNEYEFLECGSIA